MIELFVSGADTSIANANAIESAIDEHYPDNAVLQETVEMLAMYRPGGGEYLFDVSQIQRRLIQTSEYLRTL